jgi:hypothetical protein
LLEPSRDVAQNVDFVHGGQPFLAIDNQRSTMELFKVHFFAARLPRSFAMSKSTKSA